MSIESVPYPTREISDNLPLFLSDIGAVAVPVRVTGTISQAAVKGSTYITYGSGTITFTDPDISTSVSGDHYKVIVGGTSSAVIGGVTYNKVSPIEILRLVSAGVWITHSGLDASQITSGIIDAARLPSYVDDVIEFANLAAFPVTGEASKIYIALDTNKTYRWSGSVYIQINADQTITLTGAVTGSGTGSFATTLSDDVVTLAKMANVSTSTVFYRKTTGTGDPEVQSLATLKTDLGLTGTNSGDQTITLTGAVTGSGTGSFATTLSDDVVTLAKMANVATATVFYRKTTGTGDPEVQSLATLKTDLGLTGTNSGDQDLNALTPITLGLANTASGTNAVSVGYTNVASGSSGVAVGTLNTAADITSSAFGTGNLSDGISSIAVGHLNNATGDNSGAFGYDNDATSTYSYAVGSNNNVSGSYSSAFGYNNSTARAQVETATIVAASGATTAGTLNVTVTSALFSTTTVPVALLTSDNTAAKVATKVRAALALNANIAAWYNVGGSDATYTLTAKYIAANDATLNMAHAKVSPLAGITDATTSANTATGLVSGSNSTMVGYTNIASGANSTTVGYTNIASGTNSAAFGFTNTASATDSTAVGRSNEASGINSSAFGYTNTASATDSTAVGRSNTATATGSSAVGYNNGASIGSSSALGYNNGAHATSSSAVGFGNSATASSSVAFGTSNTAQGISSSAFGISNEANFNYSAAFGYGNIANGVNSSAFGNSVKTSVANTQEFGIHSSGARLSSVRVHDDGYVALSLRDTATALTDGGATVGAEADGTLMRGAYALRRNGSNLFIDANSSNGTITSNGLVIKLTSSEYTITNPPAVPLKTFNASTATIDDVYNVLATLIQTLKDRQLI